MPVQTAVTWVTAASIRRDAEVLRRGRTSALLLVAEPFNRYKPVVGFNLADTFYREPAPAAHGPLVPVATVEVPALVQPGEVVPLPVRLPLEQVGVRWCSRLGSLRMDGRSLRETAHQAGVLPFLPLLVGVRVSSPMLVQVAVIY
jgi:hypothetical protein